MSTAKNGCAKDIKFLGKKVYYDWSRKCSLSFLGNELDLMNWVVANLKVEYRDNIEIINEIKGYMVDWKLYDNGWFIESDRNLLLFYYLTQVGSISRPPILRYFE